MTPRSSPLINNEGLRYKGPCEADPLPILLCARFLVAKTRCAIRRASTDSGQLKALCNFSVANFLLGAAFVGLEV